MSGELLHTDHTDYIATTDYVTKNTYIHRGKCLKSEASQTPVFRFTIFMNREKKNSYLFKGSDLLPSQTYNNCTKLTDLSEDLIGLGAYLKYK